MKKYLYLLLLSVLGSHKTMAQHGKVVEGQTIKSQILGKDVRFTMYLPPDYNTSERTYPIVYLLHGYTDDDTGWLQFGEINRLADKAIASGEIPPMIIAMPDGGVSWYINSADGKVMYEDFFFKEFMPQVEKTYRVKAKKNFRGITGLSMGGYGTMVYALKHPDLFAAAAPLSAAWLTDDDVTSTPQDRWDFVFGPPFGKNPSKDRLGKHWYENSVIKLIEQNKVEDLKKVKYWIDCGDDDWLSPANAQGHILLKKRAIPHEFRIREGGHTWTYWRTGIIDALAFIGDSFRQK
jgi:enterochelin esterase-like enzyme